MDRRTARPTLRLLKEDLRTGWESEEPLRSLTAAKLFELHPLSELEHPVVRKASNCFGEDSDEDSYIGPIRSVTSVVLLELKVGQWRAAVWLDREADVAWVVSAGLAKGGHADFDDFYNRLERLESADAIHRLLPTPEDEQILKQETAHRLMRDWELHIQAQTLEALEQVHQGGKSWSTINYVIPAQDAFAEIQLDVDRDQDAENVTVTIDAAPAFRGSNLEWQMIIRVLVSLDPPEQGWDRYKNVFFNMVEPERWRGRVGALGELVLRGELGQSEPGTAAHYTHRKDIAEASINGDGLRALCGVFFVPRQDHEGLEQCGACETKYDELSG